MKVKSLIFAIISLAMVAMFASCNKKNEPADNNGNTDPAPTPQEEVIDPKAAPANSHSKGTVKDICGNSYNYVQIGSQTWLAENMRCDKFDSESELKGKTIPMINEESYLPGYIVASNSDKWSDGSKDDAVKLTERQMVYLGYLYTWAAAVGLEKENDVKGQVHAFTDKRQGVCPNGWHLPTVSEYQELVTFIENTDGKGNDNAGMHLRTTTGWYSKFFVVENNDEVIEGKDTYGFSLLPSGDLASDKIRDVGFGSMLWTANPVEMKGGIAYIYNTSAIIHGFGWANLGKSRAFAVRCLKD